ncbi:bacterio-opsin activator domain-containing protein [Haloarcula onubensis]|uniref:Helix-turn-helix domain-containing protein n=1 Tax=Haloarcula onubensis TaxID=2950539 RepID=A0ABU2FNV7_9EURY|nr:bacterio-opsin activator domain-containing protein [Halomicroarcula sp. S3CR25-11]MDS0282094.1 helix-turn-helix domain-containing protein [Halomicroarcula sp. S3CR25-11]
MSLFADVVLPVTAIPPGDRVSVGTDAELEFERVVPSESSTHYLWVVGEDYARVLDDLRGDAAVESVATLDEYDDRALVRVRWTALEAPFLDLLDETDGVLSDAKFTGGKWRTTLRFPDESAFSDFYAASEQRGLGLELRAVSGARFAEHGDALSAVQRKALEAAFAAGYFEVPRRTTLAGLAQQLDRSEQAVSEALRRATANYLRATLASEEPDGTVADDPPTDDSERGT